MEERMYKVLWIDDEYAEHDELIDLAYQNQIDISAFKSFNSGFKEFESKIDLYDAIILDARGIIDEHQSDGTENLNFLTKSLFKLKNLESQIGREIPYAIYSGQTDVHDVDGSFKEMYPDETVFSKLGEDEKLLTFLKNEIKLKSPEVSRLKFKHKRVFEVFDEKYKLGKSWEASLVGLLIERESGSTDVKQINEFRKFIEVIQKGLCAHGIVPVNLSLNNFRDYLNGKTVNDFKCKDLSAFGTVMPRLIESFVYNVQEGSHALEVDTHIRSTNSGYFLDKLLFELLEILVCYKLWVDKHLSIDSSSKSWHSLNQNETLGEDTWVSGQVINYNERGFAFLLPNNGSSNSFIPPGVVSNYNLVNGDSVKGLVEVYQDISTGETKTRVKSIERL
jgi:hypothetical protein